MKPTLLIIIFSIAFVYAEAVVSNFNTIGHVPSFVTILSYSQTGVNVDMEPELLAANRNVADVMTGTQKELRNLAILMNSFRVQYGKFPSGSNSNIAKQFRLIKEFNAKSMNFDENGNILDPFGIPYAFFFSANEDCAIISIGKALREQNQQMIEYYPVRITRLNNQGRAE